MNTDLNRAHRTNSIARIVVGILALAVCLGLPSFVAARQESPQGQAAPDQQNQPGDTAGPAQSPDAAAPAAAPDSDSNAPPAAQSAAPADAAPQAEAPASQGTPPAGAPQAPSTAPSSGWHYNPAPQDAAQGVPPAAVDSPAAQAAPPQAGAPQAGTPRATGPQGALPQVLTLPAGTVISVRLAQWLSSDQNHAGDTFEAELAQPIVIDGWVAARRGQSVLGRVVLAQKANHGNSESKLGVELAEIPLVDGERLTVSSELVQDTSKRSTRREVGTVGATTALGAIVGAAIGGGQGAAIGAGVGITAGMASVMVTSGRPTILRPEQLLTFRLQSPVEIHTERGHVAFRPVTQADYGNGQGANAPSLRYPPRGPYPYRYYGPAAYPPPPYYYGYPRPY